MSPYTSLISAYASLELVKCAMHGIKYNTVEELCPYQEYAEVEVPTKV